MTLHYSGTTLVTGAAGFLGQHLVRHLLDRGARVRASDRDASGAEPLRALGVEFVAADLKRPADLAGLFAGVVDRVFHTGAICNFSTPYDELEPVNVGGVDNLTALALAHGVKCFVHVSSTSVYGRYRGTAFTEDDPREPRDDYGRSKMAGEDVVFKAMKRGLPAIVARPCTIYGPGCTDGAGKAFSRRTSIPFIPGSGRQKLATVRVEDVAAALDHLSRQDSALGETYNICDASQPTVAEALTLAARIFGARPPRLRMPLGVLSVLAAVDGCRARRRGAIPDLEAAALQYLNDDYVVDGKKLAEAGFRHRFPDFSQSLAQLAASQTHAGARS